MDSGALGYSISMWNPSANDSSQSHSGYSSRGVDFANLTYGSGVNACQPDGDLQNLQHRNYSRQLPNLTNASYNPTIAWNSTGMTAVHTQELAFTRNPPPSYAQSDAFSLRTVSPPSLPPGTVTSNFSPESCFSDQTSLQHKAEVRDSPEDEGTDKESPVTVEPSLAPAPKRKRGRPKLKRRASEPSPSRNAASQRVLHNQVERKYRQTLNAEIERLRTNVPTLPQHDGTSLAGPPKPSKATVLAAAVDYIKMLEAETERLAGENEGLKSEPIG